MTPGVGVALALTLAVEVPMVSLVYRREVARMALVCTLATTATNLAMNVWLLQVMSSHETYLLIGELGATLVEALVYIVASRPHDLARAFIASGVANATSFIAGLILF